MNILLVGGDKLAYFLCREFSQQGFTTTVIDMQPEKATALARETNARVIVGDGSNPLILKEAGAYQADVLVAMTARDDINLVACQIAQHQYGVPRTIALVNDPDYREVFEQLGVTITFSPTQILASLIEERIGFEAIQSLVPIAGGQVQVTEVMLTAESPAVGETLQTIDLPEGILIGCIIRQAAVIVPRGWTELQLGDRLVLLTHAEQGLTGFEKLVAPEAPS
jgi:trk system potassium uptake protein TrkA